MRILFSSPSAVGHIHPMIPLAKALQARGHELRWATGPEQVERIAGAGIPATAAGLTGPAMREAYRSRYPEATSIPAQEMRGHVLPKMFGAVATPPMLADLLLLARDWRPDLLVHDASEFAGAIAGAKLGVPHVTHSFGAVIPSRFLRLAGAELAPLRAEHGLEPDEFAGAYQHLYLDIYPPSMQTGDLAAGRSQQLRPVTADVVANHAQPQPAVQRGSRPLVYLTFGTVFNRNPTFTAAVTALSGLDVDLLVTIGIDNDPQGLGPQPSNVRVERYIAQSLILDQCDLVVSHAGSGTLLATLARGIPQLCLPQAADQFLNAGAVAAAGAGVELAPDEATAEAIAAAARRLLGEPSFRTTASAIAAEIAAMPEAPVVAEVLERLVRN